MAERTYGVRDLRNSTAEVIEAALDGHDVVVTVNGEPKVRVVPIEATSPMDRLLADAAALPRPATDQLDQLLELKRASIDAADR